MKVLPKYRLELRWKDVEYQDEVAVLKGAYFCGPVLAHAAQINEADHLTLDMTGQHVIFAPMEDFYQATLEWQGVDYKDGRVYLKQAFVKGKYINSLEKLEKDDWILIDCKGHDTDDYAPKPGRRLSRGARVQNYKHLMVYWAEVHKQEGGEKYDG